MKKIKIKTNVFGMVLSLAAMLLVARTTPLQAQTEYHPITDGCVWSVSDEKYMTVGDTVLNGKTYMKIYRQVAAQAFDFNLEEAEYFAAIRDDSVEQRVYAFIPSGTWIHDLSDYSGARTDTALEVLLYDFSLKMGDTVCFYSIGSMVVKTVAVRAESVNMYVGETDHSVVMHQYSSSDSVVYLSDNSPRNQILLEGISLYSKPCVWIEGVGSLRGFGEGDQMNLSDYNQRMLLCFVDGAGVSYQTEFDLDEVPNDCYSTGFGGDLEEHSPLVTTVYPNPTDDLLHIELSGAEIATVALYDLQGRMVTGAGAHAGAPQRGGNVTINMRSVPAGVYLLRVTDADGKEYQRKIVKR
jgi:hypothetical protein